MSNHLQSPIVRFGVFLGSTLFVLGSPLPGYFLTMIFLEAKASEHWPNTQGELEKVEIVKDSVGRYHSEVAYRYYVEDRVHLGTRIRTSDGEYDNRKSVEENIEDLSVGQAVRVYYNPVDPKKSVLRTGAGFEEYALLFIPIIMLVMGLLGFYRLWDFKKRANHSVQATTANAAVPDL